MENLPDVAQISTILIHLKRVHENAMTQMEDMNGDAVLISEDNLKRCERLMYSMSQTCGIINARHDIPKDKLDDCMRYEHIYKVITRPSN